MLVAVPIIFFSLMAGYKFTHVNVNLVINDKIKYTCKTKGILHLVIDNQINNKIEQHAISLIIITQIMYNKIIGSK